LYSVLNACRAWRFVELDVLGSKLDGAEWARLRWPDPDVIDAAVACRRGEETPRLDEAAVDALLASVEALLREAVRK
jgi:aminoglycoside adenylyltransferase-like protein